MKLPCGNQAIVDGDKIQRYVLSLSHHRGRHKARVFRSRLGLTVNDAKFLEDELRRIAREETAVQYAEDAYGKRYRIDAPINGPNGSALVRTLWIIRHGELFPRLITCYII